MTSIAEREEQRRVERELKDKTELIAKIMVSIPETGNLYTDSNHAKDIYLYARNRAKELVAEGL